jgi:serine/threonine-protein kinase
MARKLGHYTVIEEIGRGGMAVVYRAVQESLNRDVAIKELDLERFRSKPKALDRFHLEARAAAALKHPNIITIYDLWQESEKAFIAMEFVDGAELKEVLGSLGRLDPVEASLIVLEICEALSFAHSSGMIHRDVKPANIMLSSNGEVKLMDFGIVSVSDAGDLTVTGQILGSPAYMAPEQITGEHLGPAADIFSLGAIFYEALTGSKPFTGANHVALIQNVLHSEPPPPLEFTPQISDTISQIVLKCLKKRPESRYGSMAELSTVLEMSLPLERTNRKAVVSRLVERYRIPESTASLNPEPGPENATSPFAAIKMPDETAASKLQPEAVKSTTHPLELDPPADLPPLGQMEKTAPVPEPSPESPPEEVALVLKEIPEDENDDGQYIDDLKKSGSRSKMLWVVPVILLVFWGAWVLLNGPDKRGLLPGTLSGKAPMAQLNIFGSSGATVFLNGENLGNAGTSVIFQIEPGPYLLELVHPSHGSRKFIGELKDGESKTIQVDYRN